MGGALIAYDLYDALGLAADGPTRRKFLARLQGQITKRGVIDVLRKGIDDGPHNINLFYGTPTPGNTAAEERFRCNRFTVTRQLHYSRDETKRALDFAIFINGLPIATFELKNSLTKQTVADAVEQYKSDRDPRERLFGFGRCIAHFAVDDAEVRFCTHLKGEASWFLPFNRGYKDGAGNPPNPDGLKTSYLWEEYLTPSSLTEILENYAQVVEKKDLKTKKVKRTQIFPRFQQLRVVRRLLADAEANGPGQRYLIQHSAGSGKSFSIAWLVHQLIGLGDDDNPVFDTAIVITDRRILDEALRNTIMQYAQVGETIGAVKGSHGAKSKELTRYLDEQKKIIIVTVQTFPAVLDKIGSEHRGRNFAIVIDEAHSSQGGKASKAVSLALAEGGEAQEEETAEDKINRIMEKRKLLPNASYFAFTATPKPKTIETFGEIIPGELDEEGRPKRKAFDSYTMKQAIGEGFILDVLRCYTPVNSYYRLIKTIEDDPYFDTKKAQKKLRRYIERHEQAIRLKAEIMVDHFLTEVIAKRKIGGKARAMVITNGIAIAIEYFHAISAYLEELKSPYQAIVAFSDHTNKAGDTVTEAMLNGFPGKEIADRIQQDPYRILICADKYQTGYDEPLLHTMYVDKTLAGIKAVQTLSRLNRAHPQKHDVFVLDFLNDVDTIKASFDDFYRTTILSGETDPNKLHDLKAGLDATQVYSPTDVELLVHLFLEGADRDKLDPIVDACVPRYTDQLDEDQQITFKGDAKAFLRLYGFLASILPFHRAEWERLSIFLEFLVPKLPAPKEEDLSKGVLESIDMDSYRAEKQATRGLGLEDEDAEIDPYDERGGGRKREPELDLLSRILGQFNDLFGNIEWKDADRIRELVADEIPEKVAADEKYQNAINQGDKQKARIEHDAALTRVLIGMLSDHTELFKQFSDNGDFKKWLADTVFGMTYLTPEQQVAKLIEGGESGKVEFKSSLRWNLRDEKKDKEIVTHAAIKTIAAFMNTGGGTLLIGVDDAGNAVGIEHDRFDNDDKFLLHLFAMLKQWLGVDAATKVEARVVGYKDIRVCLVECDASPRPVFMTTKHKGEEFFVRTGPMTTPLKGPEIEIFVAANFSGGAE